MTALRERATDEAANREATLAFYDRVLGEGGARGLDGVAAGYVSHLPPFSGLPDLPPGRDALAERLGPAGPLAVEVHRLVADGDLTFAHVRYGGETPVAGADILRFNAEGRIAEHWSARQAIPRDAEEGLDRFSGGGRGMTPSDDPERRERTRRIAAELMDLWRHADAAQVSRYYDDAYIQHNPDMPGGAERIRAIFETEIKAYIAATGGPFPIDCHRIGVQGDLIFVHYSVSMIGIGRRPGARSSNIDIFRIGADDRMCEHWDVLQIEGEPLPDHRTLF